jgi:hypothetical protein
MAQAHNTNNVFTYCIYKSWDTHITGHHTHTQIHSGQEFIDSYVPHTGFQWPLWQHCVTSDNSWHGSCTVMGQPCIPKNLLYTDTKRHYLPTDSRVRQHIQLPACSPLPAYFHKWPVYLLALPRNRYSSSTLCNTTHYLFVVKQPTRTLNLSQINSVLDGSCNLLFNWTQLPPWCTLTDFLSPQFCTVNKSMIIL